MNISKMRSKITQSLPLLGTLFALMLGGALLFTFTPADALLDAQPVEPLPAEAKPLSEEELAADQGADEANWMDVTVPDATSTEEDDAAPLVDHIYAAANDTVVLDDHYLNDVYVAGNTILITGTVEGDVFAAGNLITINGTVLGSVRAAGNTIKINGQVGRNVITFAGNVEINPSSHIGQDLMVNAGQADIAAMVMGDVTGNGGQITINAPITGDVIIGGVGQLVLSDEAYVTGDVIYTSEQPAVVDTAATVLGKMRYTTAEPHTKVELNLKPVFMIFKLSFVVIAWLGCLLLGSVLLKLLPKTSQNLVDNMLQKPVASFGYGALVVFCAPLLLLLIACTVIGIPLAVAGSLTLLLLFGAAKLLLGLGIGKLLLPKSKSLIGPFILGFSLIFLSTGIIGSFGFGYMIIMNAIYTLGTIWAFGSMLLCWKTCKR